MITCRPAPRFSSSAPTGRFTHLAFAILLPLCGATAQQAPTGTRPLPPPGELLKSPPTYSQWTVTFIPYQDPSAKNATPPTLPKSTPKQVTITKTGDIIHEEIIDGSGAMSERWQSGSTLYLKPPGQSYWGVCDRDFSQRYGQNDPSLQPIKGITGFEWVGPQSYAGQLNRPGNIGTLLLFLPGGGPQGAAWTVEKALTQPEVALVDGETRLPLLIKKDGVITSYQFGATPTALLKFPADLNKQIDKQRELQARAFAPPKAE